MQRSQEVEPRSSTRVPSVLGGYGAKVPEVKDEMGTSACSIGEVRQDLKQRWVLTNKGDCIRPCTAPYEIDQHRDSLSQRVGAPCEGCASARSRVMMNIYAQEHSDKQEVGVG